MPNQASAPDFQNHFISAEPERAAAHAVRCTRVSRTIACYNFRALQHRRHCIDKRFIRTNERIRVPEIRVIDDESNQLGIMRPFEALKIAREKGLDLVEVSPTAQPPVCRIMDFGKYLYDKEKSERAAKKHQKVITVKEVKFRINVDEHDYETKKKHVLRFLDEGDKVKATIFFRGREMTRQSLGRGILERLVKELGDQAIVEFRPKQEGNTLHLILAPPKVQPGQKPKSESGQKPERRDSGPKQPRGQQPAAAPAQPAPPAQTAAEQPAEAVPQPTGTTQS